eukprot:6209891-Pleurochrysis_carterae.AAC.1
MSVHLPPCRGARDRVRVGPVRWCAHSCQAEAGVGVAPAPKAATQAGCRTFSLTADKQYSRVKP